VVQTRKSSEGFALPKPSLKGPIAANSSILSCIFSDEEAKSYNSDAVMPQEYMPSPPDLPPYHLFLGVIEGKSVSTGPFLRYLFLYAHAGRLCHRGNIPKENACDFPAAAAGMRVYAACNSNHKYIIRGGVLVRLYIKFMSWVLRFRKRPEKSLGGARIESTAFQLFSPKIPYAS
jgi:hypothetical protein